MSDTTRVQPLRMTPDVVVVLRTLAAAGFDMDAEDIAAATGRSVDETLSALARAVRARHVSRLPANRPQPGVYRLTEVGRQAAAAAPSIGG